MADNKPIVVDRNSYRSLATGQPAPYEFDKKVAEINAAKANPNPLKAGAPHLMLASHGAKLSKLLRDERFGGLPEGAKKVVLQRFYDKYTNPILKKNGVEPPTFEQWLNHQSNDKYREPQEPTQKAGVVDNFQAGVSEGFGDITGMVGKALGFGISHTPNFAGKNYVFSARDRVIAYANRLHGINNDYQSMFQVGTGAAGWVANTAGHALGEAPAYLAAGEIVGAGAGLAARAGIVPTFAEKTVLSKGFKVGVKALGASTETLMVDKGEGKNNKQAVTDAVFAGLMDLGFQGLGAGWARFKTSRRPAAAAVAEVVGNGLSFSGAKHGVGGEPFHNTIADLADKAEQIPEGRRLNKGATPMSDGSIRDEGRLLEASTERNRPSDKIKSLVRGDDPLVRRTVEGEKALRERLAREFHPEKSGAAGSKEPAVAKGMTRLYHTGQEGRYDGKAWFTTDKNYKYRQGAEHQYVDYPTSKLDIDPDGYGQTPDKGFHHSVELHSDETGLRKPVEQKSVWRNLSRAQRQKIKDHIAVLGNASAETMPLTSPHVAYAANANLIEKEIASSPIQKQLHEEMSKLTGLDGAHILTEMQAREVADHMNIDTPAQHIDLAVNDSEEYEPLEGASASLKPGHSISYLKRNDNLSPAKLGSANELDFIHGTIKYLDASPATKSGKIYFENPEHHLLHIARNSTAPASVKAKATIHLKQIYGHDLETITKRSSWLAEHVNDLKRTGKIESEGNVFRSTRLTQRRYGSKWQKELYSKDTLASQGRELQSLLKSQPQLKNTILPMLEQLNKLKNKADRAKVVGARGMLIDNILESLKEMK